MEGILVSLLLIFAGEAQGFVVRSSSNNRYCNDLSSEVPGFHCKRMTKPSMTGLSASKQSRSSMLVEKEVEKVEADDGEEVYGAKFFGGSAQKEELFDVDAEAKAGTSISMIGTYDRFSDVTAFPDENARDLGMKLQLAINHALYRGEKAAERQAAQSIYSTTSLQWDSCFSPKNKNDPLKELAASIDFYRRLDVAILSAQTISDFGDSMKQMKVLWEISVVYPNFWEPRVLLSGSSFLTVDITTMTIQKQADVLNDPKSNDLLGTISSQYTPRFWDVYHVGMTPNAELLPKYEQSKPLFRPYELFEIPSRWVWKPTLQDKVGGRDNRLAEGLPNHAFTTAIKTTGPKSQRYVPTSPVQVNINRKNENGESYNEIEWTVYLPPEFLSACSESGLPIVDKDKEDTEIDDNVSSSYFWESRRLVATMPYGGSPQDQDVSEIRQKLFEKVTKDGFKAKMDENGRPIFFFWQNDCKACFTCDGGLGMAVYDWRPKSANSNEVGLELELE